MAIVADAAQVLLGTFGWSLIGELIDLVAMCFLIWLLGLSSVAPADVATCYRRGPAASVSS